jgi:hypothetical protein
MKLTFTEEEVLDIIVRNLENQGFSFKGRSKSIAFKSRFIGKGQGTINSVEIMIGDPEYSEPETEEPAVTEEPELFGDD